MTQGDTFVVQNSMSSAMRGLGSQSECLSMILHCLRTIIEPTSLSVADDFENQVDQDTRKLLRKRKREEEAVWKKAVKRKLKEEERRVTEEQENSHQVNSEMYALFNDLQGISKE